MFEQQALNGSRVNLEEYLKSVLFYINSCVDGFTTYTTIKTFPNKRPWINKEVKNLQKVHNIAFKAVGITLKKGARTGLKNGIKKAKDA